MKAFILDPTKGDLFNQMAEICQPYNEAIIQNSPAFVEACNRFNNLMFGKLGVTKSTETLYQWGIRGRETDEQLQIILNDYKEYMRDKATGNL